MRKILTRFGFVLGFFLLGAIYGAVAHADSAGTDTYEPAPRAIQCSAAFELMVQAAPAWSAQAPVIKARTAWAQHVNAISTAHNALPNEQVNQEMTLIADALAVDPSHLTDMAASCVADAPPS